MPHPAIVSWLVEQLDNILEPWKRALESPEEFAIFLRVLGWQVTPETFDMAPVVSQFAEMIAAFDQVQTLLEQSRGADDATVYTNYAESLRHLHTISVALRDLAVADPSQLPFPLNSPTFWEEFPGDLLQYLFVTHLEDSQPAIFAACLFLGIITEELITVEAAPERNPYRRHTIHWERLKDLGQPQRLLQEVYAWGTPQFQFVAFWENLERILRVLGFFPGLREPAPELVQRYYAVDNPVTAQLLELYLPFLGGADATRQLFEMGLSVLPLPPSSDAAPVGMVVRPVLRGTLPALQFGSLAFNLTGGFVADDSMSLEILPQQVSIAFPGQVPEVIEATVSRTDTFAEPLIVLGSPSSHRLQMAGSHLGLSVQGSVDDPEVQVEFRLQGMELVLDFSAGDSFVRELNGAEERRIGFDGGVTWSSKHGLTFAGQGGLEASINVQKNFGIVSIERVLFGLYIEARGVALTAAVSGGARVGPVGVVVENVGMRLLLEPRQDDEPPGNFGFLDVDFDFKPPDGLGLAIDAGVVKGGGSLFYAPEQHRYAGALVLEIGTLLISAAGLLTTRLPDGRPGYSLLISLAVSGFTPIQLGLGFTLNGIGGLLGVHRSAQVEVLRAGLKNRTLDAVLFPSDPLAQLPRLISALDQAFPATPGRHLIGPAFLIGWGTPTRLTLKLALLLELPAPLRLILLGQLRAFLPTADEALVQLNMDALGVVDFADGSVALDATLYDSRFLHCSLAGDMALRARWLTEPGFLLAVGGLHPRFNAPTALALPRLQRLTVDLTQRANPRLRLSAYLALTSNTVQFGARAELYAASPSSPCKAPWALMC